MPPSKKKRGKAAGQQAPALGQLVKAAYEGDAAAVTRLLGAGGDPNESATVRNYSEVARLLHEGGADPSLDNRNGVSPLIVAAGCGQLEVARLLLDAGADPSLADGNGVTPLMVAARQGQLELLRLLLGRGAAVDVGLGRIVALYYCPSTL